MLFGILLTLFAGFLQGSFALFLKTMRPWKWENFWFVYSLVALVIFPFVWALVATPKFMQLLLTLQFNNLLLPLLFGAMWGIGSILFGLSVIRIGVTLTYSIIISMTGILGTIIPLFLNKSLPPFHILFIVVIGLLVMLLGVGVSGWAGVLRESREDKGGLYAKTYWYGLVIAMISGVLSPMLNVGFVLGKPISETALKIGISATSATFAIWIIVLLGGFFVNVGYAVYLLAVNKSFKFFIHPSVKPVAGAVLSGICWFGGFGLFGIATVYLGTLGTSVGWAMLMGSMIIVSSFWGVLAGEWKSAKKALSLQLSSVFILLVGMAIIASALFH